MIKPSNQNESRWPYRIGVLLTLVVFPLIWVGGLVTTYDAGMAVPDWPNTYNYNMFSYPVRDWFLGPWDLFVEHGHRLLGSLAGIISIVLVIVTWRTDSRKWVQWMSVGVLALVVFQGVLGGIRVLLVDREIAKIHGCVGPFFFAFVVGFCVVTSRWWIEKGNEEPTTTTSRKRIPKMGALAITMLVVSYLQLVVGAFLRHIDVTAPPKVYNHLIAVHILTAVLILLGTIIQFLATRRAAFRGRGIRASVNILALLILVQIGLGCATWIVKYGWPTWFESYAFASQFVVSEKSFWQMNLITAHVAVGSLILAYWTIHAMRCFRDHRATTHVISEEANSQSESLTGSATPAV